MRQTSTRSLGPSWPSGPSRPLKPTPAASIVALRPRVPTTRPHRRTMASLLAAVVTHARDLAAAEEAPPSPSTPSPPNVHHLPPRGERARPSRYGGPHGGAA